MINLCRRNATGKRLAGRGLFRQSDLPLDPLARLRAAYLVTLGFGCTGQGSINNFGRLAAKVNLAGLG